MRSLRRAALVVLAGVACATCGGSSRVEPTAGDLRARFEALHRRLYDVYRLGERPEAELRDELWSFLAASFDGEALTAEYVEHFTTLHRMSRERTAIRVLEVDYEDVEVSRHGKRIRVDADWSVGGVVTHQSHRHPRINRYRASYDLASIGDGAPRSSLENLRIVGTTLRSLERVSSARAGGFPLDELPSSAGGSLSLSDLLRSGVVEPAPAQPPATPSSSSDAKAPTSPPPPADPP